MAECEHENAGFIEERLGGEDGRDYIEKVSANDAKHKINSCGSLAKENAYGEIVWSCPDCGLKTPVICGHGGSMWLCRFCKEQLLNKKVA